MLKRNITILTWFNFFTDFRLYAPIAILYFAGISGSLALGMSIFSIVMITSALFEIPTGILSDRMGRKKTVIFGATAAVGYSIFYAIGQNYIVLVIGAICEGLSRAFYSGNNDALLHDTLFETRREHEFGDFLGKTSAMFQVALATSAILGGILAIWSFQLIMWLSVIPQILCLLLSVFLIEPRIYTKDSGNIFMHLGSAYKNFITNRKLRLLSLSSICMTGFGETGYQFQAAFYSMLWPVWAIGFAKGFSNAIATLSFYFSGKLIKRFGAIKLLIFSNLYSRSTNITAVLFPTIFSPLLMSTNSAFYGVASVGLNDLMQKEFTSKERATMGSLDSFAGSIFFGIVAFAIGYIGDHTSVITAILILQCLHLSSLFIHIKLFRHK